MLMGALFGDAMGRDVIPQMFTQGVDVSLREYVRLLLRAVGVRLDHPATRA